MLTALLIAALVGYLLGSLPFGWFISRRFGIDIFQHGSQNPGATNVKRVLGEKFGRKGKRAGNLVFVCDALKGAAATAWPLLLCGTWTWQMQLTGLVFALLGHSYSCFCKFKGGKGVATSAGALAVLAPIPVLIALVIWVLVFETSRYVSLASILAAATLPLTAWTIIDTPRPVSILVSILSAFVIFRHRTNIRRLCDGTENKFVKKNPPSHPSSSAS